MIDRSDDLLVQLFESGRVNAILAWLIAGVFVVVLIESLLDRDLPWVIFATAMTAIVLVPPIQQRTPLVMLPWELLVLASFPVVVRAAEISALANTFATYLSIAAFALILTVELHVLSRVTVTHWFAVTFVVLATLATAGAWAILRWNLDTFLGTSHLTTNEALMHEFLYVLAAGLVAGVVFDLYFRRRARTLRRSLMWVIRR